MRIVPDFDMNEVDRYIEERVRRFHAAVVMRLDAIGEQAVNAARNLPSPNADDFPDPGNIPPHQPNYMDWSGNLRNSIGYVVQDGGKRAKEKFPGRGEGADKAKALAAKIAASYPTGFVLVVVAGEEYATYVTDKGYDVLDTAQIVAEQLIARLKRKMQGLT